ncbi:MFS transporter [Rhizocola hellebori]|uniref:MFS transporter n=1 Tax=Rhizocola hellebori TaxID=1392758 RepID=A0A8J3QDN0_9ACTN|nr:MFS transporter [Rhizocola hellebori]GIH08834.1 MFS transporter [Rhizocola hellebori]
MPSRLVRLLPSHPATRALIYSTLAGSSGRALFITMSVVFFTRSVGLSASEVGVGLTIAAVCGLFAGVPAGHLADRMGPRNTLVVFATLRAVGPLGYLLVHEFAGFVAVASTLALLDAASGAAHGALVAGAIPAQERVRTRAILRSVTNVGWAIGAIGAGLALHADTRAGYTTLLLVCVAFFLLSALLDLRVPAVAAAAKRNDGPTFVVLRDRPYLALTVLNAVLCVHYGMLNVAVPLWVVQRTSAPAWVVGGLGLLNAVSVIFLQVRASRGAGEATGAAAAQRVAGFLLAGACVLYALAAGKPMWVAVGILFIASAVHVLGELRQAAGSWGISFDLAPSHAQGQYQGLYSTGFALANVIAPAVLATVVIGWGWPGWALFGFLFAASGMAVPVATRWAQRTREPELATALG